MIKKVKMTQELIDRAKAVFAVMPVTYTGIGLSRQELRLLERAGYTQKTPRMAPGPLKYAWGATDRLKDVPSA